VDRQRAITGRDLAASWRRSRHHAAVRLGTFLRRGVERKRGWLRSGTRCPIGSEAGIPRVRRRRGLSVLQALSVPAVVRFQVQRSSSG
jgi:hypothetical protein